MKNTLALPLAIPLALTSVLVTSAALADINHHGSDYARPDSHAPIGVMGDHTHKAGEVMLSYRYMHMHMDGNRIGTRRVSEAQARAAGPFMVAPVEMDMGMHMLGAMYAPTDNVTLMAMAPFVTKTMDHERGNLTRFERETDGLGDITVGALVNIYAQDGIHAHFNFGLGLPTGSTDEHFGPMRLPYPMQIGSGSYRAKVGFTATRQFHTWSIGGQLMHEGSMGRNDNGYSLGAKSMFTIWAAAKVSDHFSVSLRNQYMAWDDIDGHDPRLAGASSLIPTARTDLRAGSRAELGLGVNATLSGGHRLAAEVLLPYHQNLDGPQLETDWTGTVGYQYAW